MLLAVYDPDPAQRSLVMVRDLLMLTAERLTRVMAFQQKGEAKTEGKMTPQAALYKLLKSQAGRRHGHICAGVAEQLEAMGDNECGSVLSAARTQTQWLDNDRMRKTLADSNFALEDLKQKPMTIYLCLPSRYMSTHAKWLRLMVMQALAMMQKTRIEVKPLVLFMLDEFAALGHFDREGGGPDGGLWREAVADPAERRAAQAALPGGVGDPRVVGDPCLAGEYRIAGDLRVVGDIVSSVTSAPPKMCVGR